MNSMTGWRRNVESSVEEDNLNLKRDGHSILNGYLFLGYIITNLVIYNLNFP